MMKRAARMMDQSALQEQEEVRRKQLRATRPPRNLLSVRLSLLFLGLRFRHFSVLYAKLKFIRPILTETPRF